MNIFKKPAAACAVALIALVGGSFLGANRSVASLEKQTETSFYQGTDRSGYGIDGLLDDRLEYAGYLVKVASPYASAQDAANAVEDARSSLQDAQKSGSPRRMCAANAALTERVTALNLAMQEAELSQQAEQYRAEYVAELNSYNQKITHLATDYNEQVRTNRRTAQGFPVRIFTFGRFDVEEYQ